MSRTRRLLLEGLEGRYVLDGSLSIADLTDDEGTIAGPPTGYVEFRFPVTYSGDAVSGGFDLNWSVLTNGTAVAADFNSNTLSGTLHFDGLDDPGGETKDIVVLVAADKIVERNETFQVDLGAVSVQGITISDGRADGVISNDDEAVITTRINQVDVSFVGAPEGNTGTNTTYVVKFYMDNTVDTDISFNYDFIDWDATQGVDYTVSSDHGSVANWNMEGYHLGVQLTVTIVGDNLVEVDEDFSLKLSDLVTGGRNVRFASSQATDFLGFEMQNDDTATVSITVQPTSASLDEEDSGTHTVTFDVKVDQAVDTSFIVNVNTSAGTASAGDNDYVINSANINFTGGTVNETHTYTVQVVGDTKVELDETFSAVISSISQASGRSVVPSTTAASSTATIVNDDDALVSISGNSAYEGDSGTNNKGLFTLHLNHAVAHDVVVTVTAWGITASASGTQRDFDLPQSGQFTVTIPAGQTSAVLNIPVIGDLRDEPNETIGALIASIDANVFDVAIDGNNDEATGTILDEFTDQN